MNQTRNMTAGGRPQRAGVGAAVSAALLLALLAGCASGPDKPKPAPL